MISAWNRNPPGSAAIPVRPGERIAQLVFTTGIAADPGGLRFQAEIISGPS
jgi:dUTP pyrophosphatase